MSGYVPPHLRNHQQAHVQAQQAHVQAQQARNPFRRGLLAVDVPATTTTTTTTTTTPSLLQVDDFPALAAHVKTKAPTVVVSFSACVQGKQPVPKPVVQHEVPPGWVRLKPWKKGPPTGNRYLQREAIMQPIRDSRALFKKRVWKQMEEVETQNALHGDLSPYWGQTADDVLAIYFRYLEEEDEAMLAELDDQDGEAEVVAVVAPTLSAADLVETV